MENNIKTISNNIELKSKKYKESYSDDYTKIINNGCN